MPGTVAEIMDPEFFYASQGDSIGQLLHDMAELGLGSAPVLDLAGHPLGMATVREIDGCRHVDELPEHMKKPVVSVHQNTSIDGAARILAEHNADFLILVDDRGVAVGALRALDLLRAVLGLRIRHAEHDLTPQPASGWSRGVLLDLAAAHHAPSAPGIILLDPGGGERPNITWVEEASSIRDRLDEMLRLPQDEPILEQLLGVHPRRVIIRALVVTDPERRARLVRSLRAVLARRRAKASDSDTSATDSTA